MSPETVTLAEAREILSFPKTLGHHPESGEPVVAQDGPRGPYLRAGDESRSLQDHDQLRQVTLEEALAILSRPRGGARRGAQAPLAELGPPPAERRGGRAARRSLRPLRHRRHRHNASIPRGTEPSAVDLEMAVALLAAPRAAHPRGGGRARPPAPALGRPAARRRRAERLAPPTAGRPPSRARSSGRDATLGISGVVTPGSFRPCRLPPDPVSAVRTRRSSATLDDLRTVRRRSPHTLRNYRADLRGFLDYLERADVFFLDAGRSHGRGYLALLREREVVPASVKRCASTIRGFYGWLDTHGVPLGARPGDSILRLRHPKAPSRLPRFLTEEETAALLAGAPADPAAAGSAAAGSARDAEALRDRAILELLYGAGLRVAEVVGLRRLGRRPRGAARAGEGQGRPPARRALRRSGPRRARRLPGARPSRTSPPARSRPSSSRAPAGGSRCAPCSASCRRARAQRRARRARAPAPAAPQLRDAHARQRGRSARRPAPARALLARHHAGLHGGLVDARARHRS